MMKTVKNLEFLKSKSAKKAKKLKEMRIMIPGPTALIVLIVFLMVLTGGLSPGRALAAEQLEAGTDQEEVYLCQPAVIQGGTVTDGKDLRNIRWGRHEEFERFVLDIHHGTYEEAGPPAEKPCWFEVEYQLYPPRFVITLMGVRARRAEYARPDGSCLIRDIYSLPFLDDSGLQFALELKQPVKFEVFELEDPARIVLDIKPLPEAEKREKEWPVRYSVRTTTEYSPERAGHVENIALIREELGHMNIEDVRILRAEDGKLLVEAGLFRTRSAAEEKLEKLEEEMADISFFIERREVKSMPAAEPAGQGEK